jgi:hypothetical protein
MTQTKLQERQPKKVFIVEDEGRYVPFIKYHVTGEGLLRLTM